MFRLSNKQFVRQNMAVFPCEPTTRVDVKRASSCGDRDQNRRRESNSVKRCDASRKVPASRGPSLDLDDSVPSRKLFKEIPRPLYYESLHSFVENRLRFYSMTLGLYLVLFCDTTRQKIKTSQFVFCPGLRTLLLHNSEIHGDLLAIEKYSATYNNSRKWRNQCVNKNIVFFYLRRQN